MKHSILDTGEQLGKVQDGLGIHVTTFHHPSPHSTCMVHQVHDSYYMASKHIAVNLHESNITDCAIAPPVTILVPRRAPIYYDGSISSVACKCLNDRSLGSRTNNVGTASPLTLITRSGSRCCVYTFMHSDYCCLMRT